MKEFSVLMSVYKNDNAKFTREAVESVVNQTVKPTEIIIVIDGPVSDEIMGCLNNLQGKNAEIKLLPLKENVGLGNALKEGIEHCSYDLIARMDSDDISLPDRFEKQLKCFEDNDNLSAVSGAIAEFIDNPENIVGIRELPAEDDEIKRYLKSRCPLNHVAVMFRKKDVMNAGGYLHFHYNEDYYLWVRMYLKGANFYNLHDIIVNVRVGKDMYRRRGGRKYFKSEARLQKFMLQNKIICFPRYFFNVLIRFILQVLMPNSLRGFVFRTLARKKQLRGKR